MDNLQEYIKEKYNNDKKLENKNNILSLFKFLIIALLIFFIWGSIMLFEEEPVIGIIGIIGSVLGSLFFYLFALMIESIFEINEKIK